MATLWMSAVILFPMFVYIIVVLVLVSLWDPYSTLISRFLVSVLTHWYIYGGHACIHMWVQRQKLYDQGDWLWTLGTLGTIIITKKTHIIIKRKGREQVSLCAALFIMFTKKATNPFFCAWHINTCKPKVLIYGGQYIYPHTNLCK